MEYFEFKGTKIIFNDVKEGQKVILDYSPLRNHSALSTFQMGKSGFLENVFLNRLSPLFKKIFDLYDLSKLKGNGGAYILSLLLVVQEMISNDRKYRILEIGCDTGILSVILAEILKQFNKDNRLICVSEEQVDTNTDLWLNLMSTSPAADIVSRYIGNFGELPFEDDYFDLVIINGNTSFKHSKKVLQEAIKIIRNKGILLGMADNRPDLSGIFQKNWGNSKVYTINKKIKIFEHRVSNEEKKKEYSKSNIGREKLLKEKITNNLQSIKAIFDEARENVKNKIQLDDLIALIDSTEDSMILMRNMIMDSRIKLSLNLLKESLIDYRLNWPSNDVDLFGCIIYRIQVLDNIVQE
ncbi:class I SAM-dependent methyltransferase, partial [Liquorilactobacillus hordei]|uniref:class I SAM-dependent methyltransferase n=1 Tax=Liquorilactobacillus hordei TaxID=468911 RepID=UPI0039E85846